jgi:hypothetical protein
MPGVLSFGRFRREAHQFAGPTIIDLSRNAVSEMQQLGGKLIARNLMICLGNFGTRGNFSGRKSGDFVALPTMIPRSILFHFSADYFREQNWNIPARNAICG